jgi:hypothetical protein
MDNLFQNIKPMFNNSKLLPNLEVELRLGKKNRNMFDTNVGYDKFSKIKEALDNFTAWEEVKHTNTSSYFVQDLRYEINEDTDETKTIKKKKISKYDCVLKNEPLDVRFSICQEIPQPEMDVENVTVEYMRQKDRTSYIRKNLSIDLTIVSGTPDDPDDESDTSYEVEFEFVNPALVQSENTLYNIIYKIQCILKTL